jgi:exonuclease VII small subunit
METIHIPGNMNDTTRETVTVRLDRLDKRLLADEQTRRAEAGEAVDRSGLLREAVRLAYAADPLTAAARRIEQIAARLEERIDALDPEQNDVAGFRERLASLRSLVSRIERDARGAFIQ